ncbi:hypothetical protein K474DRAFT_1663763 [Panus rudis PR-1116 ss-1]|nr:hypothetical protein K474DRAFT_1663763 [Panus rudis PR-1116 ss-1]
MKYSNTSFTFPLPLALAQPEVGTHVTLRNPYISACRVSSEQICTISTGVGIFVLNHKEWSNSKLERTPERPERKN